MTQASPPKYPFVHVDVAPEDAELVSLQLFEWGALGVEERDASTFTKSDGQAHVTLVGSFADTADAEVAAAELCNNWPARLEFVTGDDWRDGWRAHFKPTRVGKRLVIRPSWEAYEPAEQDVVLTLDPGGAFGTGTHESTRLVLEILEELPLAGVRLLDVGCGSGILSIAALLLSADSVVAVDVDEAAIAVTRENAHINGVSDRVDASTTPLIEVGERFSLVLANIEAHVLIPLAEAVSSRVLPGGKLVLSGILTHQGDEVVRAYPGLNCIQRKEQGEWVALLLEKTSDG